MAIRVAGLGKEYTIGGRGARYKTFRESFVHALARPFRYLSHRGEGPAERIWALKDVSFEVEQGEVLGVIGRNGAGKSTLLKILSRITEPTDGYARIRGRVGSLLEVGTGFHSELTGRENIYLNGSILGMRRTEIKSKFDEIIAFAEVEKFLDTQVKFYSSGMYMRLAFSVAAHFDPDILLVDEVLAVGDAVFQVKCLAQMGKIQRQGKTILFVSHNMNLVSSICQRGIVLDEGNAAFDGKIQDAINFYEGDIFQTKYLQKNLR